MNLYSDTPALKYHRICEQIFRLFPLFWIFSPASLYAFFPSSVLLHQNAHKPACSPKLAHITSVSAPYFPFLPKTANMSGQKFQKKYFQSYSSIFSPSNLQKSNCYLFPHTCGESFLLLSKFRGKKLENLHNLHFAD